MSKIHKNLWTVLNYTDVLFILVSGVTDCVSVSVTSLVDIQMGIVISAIELKVCITTARIK